MIMVSMESLVEKLSRAWPYLLPFPLQFCSGLVSILVKTGLNRGMNQHIFVVYRMVIASLLISPFAFFFEKKSRPEMTASIFAKTMLLSLFEPVVGQTLYYTGMKYTTATFATAMSNSLPALTFLLAWIFRIEKMKFKKLSCQAKLAGTVIAIGGAIVLSVVKGPSVHCPWIHPHHQQQSASTDDNHGFVMGSIMVGIACLIWGSYYILQDHIIKLYPAKLTIVALQCYLSVLEGTIVAFVIERGNTSPWIIRLDFKLLVYLVSGVYSVFSYYISALLVKKKGPVFVSAFSPLSTVLVAIIGLLFLHEDLSLGRIVGACVIIIGLYMVLWGKTKDRPQETNDIITLNEMTTEIH